MHFLHADAAYLNKAPDFANAFVSPRTRNQVVQGLMSETVYSVQGGYILQSSKVKAIVDLFYSKFNDQSEVRSFYFDDSGGFLNFVMTGVDKTYQGLELGVEYNVVPGLTVFGVGNLGYYRYSSRPIVGLYFDYNSDPWVENETSYLKGYLISGTPQTAFSAGVKYFAPKYWWIGVNANYLDDNYISISALTRTSSALKFNYYLGPEIYNSFVTQEKYPSYYTLDAFLGKSFRFNYKYYLNISLNVSNVLNKTDIITGGYEQVRIGGPGEVGKFDPKYYYAQGIQYFLNVNFRF
jgi:outer membrane receptor protein involved in Fe transport